MLLHIEQLSADKFQGIDGEFGFMDNIHCILVCKTYPTISRIRNEWMYRSG